jgi:hypothetical protein
MERFFCAEASAASDEPLLGTAPSAWRWLGIDVEGAWEPDPLASAGIAPALREALARYGDQPGARVQLLKPEPRARRQAWYADTRPGHQRLVRWDAPDDDALIAAIDALAASGPPAGATPVPRAVWVCTHGRRDACCARYGAATWRALVEAGVPALQTSHLGGHRFAATLAVFPDGLVYGRVKPEDAPSFVDDAPLARLRGRSALPAAAQVAEGLVRASEPALGALRAATVTPADGAFDVELTFDEGPRSIRVTSVRGPELRTSCASEETSRPPRWSAVP